MLLDTLLHHEAVKYACGSCGLRSCFSKLSIRIQLVLGAKAMSALCPGERVDKGTQAIETKSPCYFTAQLTAFACADCTRH